MRVARWDIATQLAFVQDGTLNDPGDIDPVFQPGAEVRGFVLCADGRPSAGATVIAVQSGWSIDRRRVLRALDRFSMTVPFRQGLAGAIGAKADEHGRYALLGLAEGGSYDVFAADESGRMSELSPTVAPAFDVGLRVPEATDIRVRVPPAPAGCFTRWFVDGERADDASDLGDGSWVLPNVSFGDRVLSVERGGRFREALASVGTSTGTISLELPNVAVQGSVVDELGNPVADARVVVTPLLRGLAVRTSWGEIVLPHVARTVTDSTGSFRVDDPGTPPFDVFVWSPRMETSAVCASCDGSVPLNLRLQRSPDVTLDLIASDGALLNDQEARVYWAPVPYEESEKLGSYRPFGGTMRVESGSVELRGLSPGRNVVTIEVTGYARTVVVVNSWGASPPSSVVTLRKLGEVGVTVLDHGAPVHGADVYVDADRGMCAWTRECWNWVGRTNREGTFRLDGIADPVWVRVEHSGEQVAVVRCEPGRGASPVVANLAVGGWLEIAVRPGGVGASEPFDVAPRSGTWHCEGRVDRVMRTLRILLPTGDYEIRDRGGRCLVASVRADTTTEIQWPDLVK